MMEATGPNLQELIESSGGALFWYCPECGSQALTFAGTEYFRCSECTIETRKIVNMKLLARVLRP